MLVLPEPQKPLEKPNNVESEDEISKQIAHIQRIFQKSYKGEFATKFVIEMLQEKGYAHIMQCLAEYRKYIDGQNIRNIAGHFYKFVMEGYTEPVAHKGNVPQRNNFEQREYLDEFYRKVENRYLEDEDESESKGKKEFKMC